MRRRRLPIQHFWFCQSFGKPKPKRETDFNDFFQQQLNEVRQAFQLAPASFGLDISNYLRPVLVRSQPAFAMLQSYQWNLVTVCENRVRLSIEPHLALCLHRSDLPPSTIDLDGATQGEFVEVLNLPFTLEYPSNYPQERPRMFINQLKLPESSTRVHFNNMSGANICTMNADNDWVPGHNSTMLNSLDALIDWMMAHYQAEMRRRR